MADKVAQYSSFVFGTRRNRDIYILFFIWSVRRAEVGMLDRVRSEARVHRMIVQSGSLMAYAKTERKSESATETDPSAKTK